jgi:hypothetical protein
MFREQPTSKMSFESSGLQWFEEPLSTKHVSSGHRWNSYLDGAYFAMSLLTANSFLEIGKPNAN